MTKVLPGNLKKSQLKIFLLYARLEEINKQIYTLPTGLTRSTLEDSRIAIAQKIMHLTTELSTSSSTKTSSCSKAGTRWQERVIIPADLYPNINFVGLLIGPRGNTLKRMEADSGAKISIRGKGAEKEGRVRSDGTKSGGQEEDLHCVVTGESEAAVKKCVDLIRAVIQKAYSSPEAENEMKQNQLRELAILNGTLREGADLTTCSNCGAIGHRKFECPERKNVTASLICKICSGYGHTTMDCVHRNDPRMVQAARNQAMQIENEYLTFMSQL
jgi:splicing factor 1